MNRRSKALGISGATIFAVTGVISSICIKDWSGITPFAFVMILWSEITFFGGLIFVEKIAKKTEQVITRSSFSVLLTVYGALNTIISVIFIVNYKNEKARFVVIQLIFVAILIITLLFAYTSSKSIKQSNDKVMEAVDNIEMLIQRLHKLSASVMCEQYSSSLKKLGEELRFTDISILVPEDMEISNCICSVELELTKPCEEISDHEIQKSIVRLSSLITQRKWTASASKKRRI